MELTNSDVILADPPPRRSGDDVRRSPARGDGTFFRKGRTKAPRKGALYVSVTSLVDVMDAFQVDGMWLRKAWTVALSEI